jgi:hypothetical protein
VLALFNKAIRKFHGQLRASKEAAVGRTLPVARHDAAARLAPHAVGVDEDLDEAAAAVRAEMRGRFTAEELARYAVTGAAAARLPAPLPALSPAPRFAPGRMGSLLLPLPLAAAPRLPHMGGHDVGAAKAPTTLFLKTPPCRQAWTRNSRRRSTPRPSNPAAS